MKGKTWLPEWRDYEALVWQFLDGNFDSIIVWDSE